MKGPLLVNRLYCSFPTFLLHVHGAAVSLSANVFCGGSPVMADSNAVWWSNPLFVNNSYVEVRKAVNISTQTGCLSLIDVESSYTFPDNSPSYTFPAMNYDSLYIAKVFWLDNSYNVYHRDVSTRICIYIIKAHRRLTSCVYSKPIIYALVGLHRCYQYYVSFSPHTQTHTHTHTHTHTRTHTHAHARTHARTHTHL